MTRKEQSSSRQWIDPLKVRKRLTKEEAEGRAALKDVVAQDNDVEAETFGGRLLGKDQDPWQHNAWDHVEPPQEYYETARQKIAQQELTRLSSEEASKYHSSPASYWDAFYTANENRFFKDRKWLHLEFPELIKASMADAPPMRIMEVGCGAGNTIFPLLQANKNPGLEMHACDYASEAVQVVKNNSLYSNPPCGRCMASVWDVTSSGSQCEANLPHHAQPNTFDIVVLIFVLSALHPEEWSKAVGNVRALLKPGGLVLIRDYGRHDLPQLRFGKGRLLQDNFYVRGDGTRVYFFEPQELIDMFDAGPVEHGSKSAPGKSFAIEQMALDRRMIVNRKEKKQMYRNWLQAKFRYQAKTMEPSM